MICPGLNPAEAGRQRQRQRERERINVIGVGYEGLDIDDLLSGLRVRGVSVVVDVRLNAISRKRGFAKNGLSERLEAEGIAYEHLPALGNPRDNREAFADLHGVDGAVARDRFGRLLREPAGRAGLDRIIELSAGGTVALLCFEHDESACHRGVILEAVRERLPASSSRSVDPQAASHGGQ